MENPKKPARAFSFAHLLSRAGIGADNSTDDGVDDKQQRDDESDEDYAKRMEEEEKKQRGDESDEDYAKRMAEDDDDTSAEDSDDEKEKAGAVKERARCAAIFSCAAAATRPDVAAHLAFSTDMSSADAVGMLNTFAATGPAGKQSLASRMASVKVPNVGSGAKSSTPAGPAGAAAAIIAAGKARRGEA